MKKIVILPESALRSQIESKPTDKIIWINIRSPNARQPIKLCPQLDELPYTWILQLRFEDIRVKVAADRAWTLFDETMADRVAAFVNQDWDLLIVNCEAGVSRSAAIGLAVAEHFGLPSPLEDRLHTPNLIVLELMRRRFQTIAPVKSAS